MEIKDVENLARLARIDLGEDEKKELLSDLESILGYVKQIEQVKVEPQSQDVPEPHNVWREDESDGRDFSRETIIEQFSGEQDGFLKVKKIL